MQAGIYGLAGDHLTADERAFFADADPAGYIIFQRNCVDRDQLRALTDDLRAIHGRDDLPILIDQEGGRVARMKPPALAGLPGGAAVRRTLPGGADQRDRGGAGECPGGRSDAARRRHQR